MPVNAVLDRIAKEAVSDPFGGHLRLLLRLSKGLKVSLT